MVAFPSAALDAFLSEHDDTPVVMSNLLKFEPIGGRQRYLQYLEMAKPILSRFGAKILFSGDGLSVLTTGQVEGWDSVALVRYPLRSTFRDMIADPEYQVVFKIALSAYRAAASETDRSSHLRV